MEKCRPVRILGRSQTAALNLLRTVGSSAPEGMPDLTGRLLRTLLNGWRARGLAISRPGSGYASPDEYLLLAALAWAQNRASVLTPDVALAKYVDAGAKALAQMHIHLPLSQPMLQLLEAKGWAMRLAPAEALPDAETCSGFDRVRRARAGKLRERAVTFAAGKPSVTTAEFRAIGISRQYLRTISAGGHLERVAYGRYRVPPVGVSGGEDERNGHLAAHDD